MYFILGQKSFFFICCVTNNSLDVFVCNIGCHIGTWKNTFELWNISSHIPWKKHVHGRLPSLPKHGTYTLPSNDHEQLYTFNNWGLTNAFCYYIIIEHILNCWCLLSLVSCRKMYYPFPSSCSHYRDGLYGFHLLTSYHVLLCLFSFSSQAVKRTLIKMM